MKTKIVLIILMSAFSFVAIGKQQSDIKNPEKYSINNENYKSLYLDKFLNLYCYSAPAKGTVLYDKFKSLFEDL